VSSSRAAPGRTSEATARTTGSGASDQYMSSVPEHILVGHDDEVTSLCIEPSLDIIVSGSKARQERWRVTKEGA